MINIIWFLFIILGIAYSFYTGNISLINNEIITSSKKSLDIFLGIFPNIVFWLGIMTIAVDSGLLNKLSKLLHPILIKLFPEIPSNHESLNYISINLVANILGLGSASTPFGLKAIKKLQELNPKKDTISRSMITFIILNISGFTIIPTTIISVRSMNNSSNPTIVLPIIIIVTFLSTLIGLILDRFINKVKNE